MILPVAGTRATIQLFCQEGHAVPKIERQSPPRPPQPTFSAGSVLASAVPVSTLREEKVKVCIYGRNRCLAGDTVIRYIIMDAEGRQQNGKGGTLELLYRRFNNLHRPGRGYYQRPQTVGSSYHISSVTDEGRVFNNKIEGVTDSGRREVFRMTTSTGRCLKATEDHLFLTETGYVPLAYLSVGDEVMVNPRVRKSKGGRTKYQVRRKELFVKNHGAKRMKVVNGCVYYRVRLSHAVYEASENGLSLKEYINLLNKCGEEEADALWRVPDGAEIHHLDENPLNDEITNLFLTESGPEHQRKFHHDAIRDRFGIYAELDPIVSIDFVGEENTYDIQVRGPYNNFDAAGIIVHNSGKTTLAAQFPKPILFVSCEPANCGGVQSVSDVEDATVIRVELNPLPGEKLAGREKVKAIGQELVKVNHFQTVVLKTVTSLQEVITDEMKRENPGLPWAGKGSKDTYQMRSDRFKEAVRPFLDLKHVNVVILAQEKDHNPPSDEKTGFPDLKAKLLQTMQQGSFMAPALGAALVTWVNDACGYILQIYEDEVTEEIQVPTIDAQGRPGPPSVQRVPTGRRQRHLRLKYHPNFAAGGKWNFDPNLPEAITAPTPAALYAELSKYIPALR